MNATFKNTTVGLNITDGDTNMIDYTTGVQIWQSWIGADKAFAIGVPASVRNGGVRCVKIVRTIEEAVAFAGGELADKAARRMARLHAAALKINAAR